LTTPAPENNYTVTSTMDMTPDLFNAIFGSIGERLTAREELEADFEDLIAAGTSAALNMIQENIAPQLGELQQTIDDALAEVAIITEGVAPDTILFNGQAASFYLNPANFSVSANVKSFLAAADYAAMRTAMSVPTSAAVATDISTAVGSLSATLGDSSTRNVGVGAGTVASGADTRFPPNGTNDRVLAWVAGAYSWAQTTFAMIASSAIATAAEWRANTASKLLSTNAVWAAAVPVALGNLTGNVTLTFSDFVNATATLTGNITLNGKTALKQGQTAVLELIQDGTGGRTLSLNTTHYSSAGGAGITLSTAAGARDIVMLYGLANGKALVVLSAKGVA